MLPYLKLKAMITMAKRRLENEGARKIVGLTDAQALLWSKIQGSSVLPCLRLWILSCLKSRAVKMFWFY